MRIQHNIMAMNAYRNYNTNTSALSKNLEKLSSGYKINRAGDDAAGLAISEKMRAQITGLNAAQKNVKDGISLVKTAEGAMQEIQDMLNRMDYLATQSANGTYDDPVDRANLQKEVNALKTEIDRIADSANFNGINLLDGSWAKVAGSGDGSTVDPSKFDMTALGMVEVKKNDTSGSVDGVARNPANAAVFKFTASSGMDLSKLDSATFMHGSETVALKDFFDIKVNGETLDTSSSTAFQDLGDSANSNYIDKKMTIELVAKNEGRLSNAWDATTDKPDGTGTFAAISNLIGGMTFACDADASGATGTGASFVSVGTSLKFKKIDGNNIGETAAGGNDNATYKFTINTAELKGGDKIVIGGQTISFITDASSTAATDGKVGFGDLQLNASDSAVQQTAWDTLVERVEAELAGTLTSAKGFSYDDVEIDDDGNLSFTITMENNRVNAGSGSNTNQGMPKIDSATGSITQESISGTDGSTSKAAGEYAQAVYKLNPKDLKAGSAISVGGVTLEIVKDDDESLNDDGFAVGKISEKDLRTALQSAGDTNNILNQALQLSGLKGANVTIDSSNQIRVTYAGDQPVDMKAAEWAQGGGKVEIGKAKATEPEEPAEPAKGGKALTLQIGDTAQKFNQLEVNIGDMHVKAMGFELDEKGNITANGKSIQDIDISSLEGAQEAISTIKNAINYVSSIRGDLGATQNRLEHTQKNLSVMAENIQDAESTIRDTDVAEEMMAYTKNNILIQSAQAMLAQANAVPQGVLQLLG